MTSRQIQPSRRTEVIFAVLMSGVMSIFFAGLFGYLAYGFTLSWLEAWLQGVVISWPLGGVLASFVAGPLRQLADMMSRRRH